MTPEEFGEFLAELAASDDPASVLEAYGITGDYLSAFLDDADDLGLDLDTVDAGAGDDDDDTGGEGGEGEGEGDG